MLGLRKEADMETLAMSIPERRRLEVLGRVRRGEVAVVKDSELVGLGYRQMKRLWARYRQEGDCGVVHRLRGQPSNRRQHPRRERVVALYQKHYADFGPTLATEYLAKEHELPVAVETLRQWLLAAGLGLPPGGAATRPLGRCTYRVIWGREATDGFLLSWVRGSGAWGAVVVD